MEQADGSWFQSSSDNPLAFPDPFSDMREGFNIQQDALNMLKELASDYRRPALTFISEPIPN